jgi:hypothetical protein
MIICQYQVIVLDIYTNNYINSFLSGTDNQNTPLELISPSNFFALL